MKRSKKYYLLIVYKEVIDIFLMKGFYFGLIILLSVGLFNCVENYTKYAKNIEPHYYSVVREYNLLDKYSLKYTKENILSFVRDKDIKAEVEECFKDADRELEFSWSHYNGVNGVTYSLKTSYEKSLKLLFIVFVKIKKVTYDVIPITVTERVKKCKRFLFVKKCHYENEQKQITPSLSDTQIQEIYKTGVAIAMEEVKKKYERYVDSIN